MQKTKHKPDTNFKRFYCLCPVEPNVFSKDQTARADGYCFWAENGETVRVLQSTTVTQKEFGLRLQACDQRLRHGSGAPIAPFLICPEVGMPGTSPVVVLQDGTVGTETVPKQT